MKSGIKSPKKIIVPMTVILLLLVIITVGFRMFHYAFGKAAAGFFHPYLKLAGSTSGKIRDRSLLSMNRIELARRVEMLTERNRELVIKSSAAAGLLEENRILRRKQRLAPPSDWHYTVGEIMLRDPLRFKEGFTVDRGSRDGIAVGDSVVESTSDGRLHMVGVVESCNARSCRVMTIANTALKISARIGKSETIGFTNTGNAHPSNGTIRLGMLPIRNDYIPGQAVVTTGFERGIPAGIKIGELQPADGHIEYSANAPDFSCLILPEIKLDQLRFVVIISRIDEKHTR